MTPEKQLRVALAHILNDHGLGVYSTNGIYSPTDPGVFTDGKHPTLLDDFTSLSSSPSVREGRANKLFRVQFYTRRKGDTEDVEQWAHDLAQVLDHKEYFPNILGISWAEEFSRLYFDEDTQDRVAVSVNYSFRGRV
ncbi:hypothetical protein ACSAGD_10720 [Paramicrobacterium sp. CJ85]|uniref:hypothetical protein n=1 Tax=Paramicrobacterium sp. CJ85 TaxID=3445355 RepID=UPI003F5F85F9